MRVLLCSLSLALVACIPTTTETRFVVNDPSSIALVAGPEDEVIVPRGDGPREALLDEGRLETSSTSAADYRVYALREQDGRLALRWETRLALRDGELQRISPEENTIVMPGHAFESEPPGNALRVRKCAGLGRSYGYKGVFVGYSPTPRGSGECERGDGQVRYSLVVPWKDVIEIKERTTPTAKWLAWSMLPMSLALIGGGLAMAVPPHASMARHIGGGAIAALGLAIQIPLTPSLFAHTREISIGVPRN